MRMWDMEYQSTLRGPFNSSCNSRLSPALCLCYINYLLSLSLSLVLALSLSICWMNIRTTEQKVRAQTKLYHVPCQWKQCCCFFSSFPSFLPFLPLGFTSCIHFFPSVFLFLSLICWSNAESDGWNVNGMDPNEVSLFSRDWLSDWMTDRGEEKEKERESK